MPEVRLRLGLRLRLGWTARESTPAPPKPATTPGDPRRGRTGRRRPERRRGGQPEWGEETAGRRPSGRAPRRRRPSRGRAYPRAAATSRPPGGGGEANTGSRTQKAARASGAPLLLLTRPE